SGVSSARLSGAWRSWPPAWRSRFTPCSGATRHLDPSWLTGSATCWPGGRRRTCCPHGGSSARRPGPDASVAGRSAPRARVDRTVPRAILHVDMDAFYASVEQRDRPELRGKPVIVGGHPRRGVVLAASYEVRPFGVRSAIPMARALVLAPGAVVVPPRFAAYSEASEQVFAILERYPPLTGPPSLDGAFPDVTASQTLFGTPAEIATRLRREIAAEVHLPASAGIACSKFVAKIASDLAKPDGQREVRPEDTRAFLARLPVARLWGGGPKLEARLHQLGLRLVGALATRDPEWLAARLGDVGAPLAALARGEDDRTVVPDRSSKSIGAEDTFEEDVSDLEVIRPRLHAQALRV